MKHLLALLALAWIAASGQQNDGTLVGLPQYGVTLSGTAQTPVVHNISGRTVIYVILKLDYAEGPSTYRPVKVRFVRRPGDSPEGIPPGGFMSIPQIPAPTVVVYGDFLSNPLTRLPSLPKTPTDASVDAIIFSDGEFVGPDSGGKFASLTEQFAAEQELATLVAAARNDPSKREAAWAEVDRLRPGQLPEPGPKDHLKMELAQMLFYTLERQGETAAYDMADREMTLPKLWRAAQ